MIDFLSQIEIIILLLNSLNFFNSRFFVQNFKFSQVFSKFLRFQVILD